MSIKLTPMIGRIAGPLNGFSGEFNIALQSNDGRFSLQSSNEYILSTDSNQHPSFFYDWSKASWSFGCRDSNKPFEIGFGIQFQGISMENHLWWAGPLLRVNFTKLIHIDMFNYYNFLYKTNGEGQSKEPWVYTFALDIEE